MKIQYCLENTLLTMLKTRYIDDIKVKEILDDIGICKGTFYKYYCDKYDLLQHCFDHNFYNDIVDSSPDYQTYVHNLIDVVNKNKAIFLHAFQSNDVNNIKVHDKELVKTALTKTLKDTGVNINKTFLSHVLDLYSTGITDIILRWLKDEINFTSAQLEDFVLMLVPNCLVK